MDPAESTTQQVATLAHEAGHAGYDLPPAIRPNGLTKDEYVKQSVDRNMRDEGNAQFAASRSRQEILDNGGPDIGTPGTQDYKGTYDQHRAGNLTEEQAIDRMSEQMGNERTSTTKESYRDYYGKPLERSYDQGKAAGAF
jgi:hypothetical protein